MQKIIQGYPFTFYDEIFTIYLADDKNWYIPLRNVCEALGLDSRSQRRRIADDGALFDAIKEFSLDTPYQDTVRKKDVLCLNVRRLPYWLGTIDANRVKEEHKGKIVLFKREFADAAWSVFRTNIIPADILAEIDASETPERQQYNRVMDELNELRKKLIVVEDWKDEIGVTVDRMIDDMQNRLGRLEESLSGVVTINSQQQMLIKKMIEAVGETIHANNVSKVPRSKAHAISMNEFKEYFLIPVYSALPADKYDAAVEFLRKRWVRYNPPGARPPEIFDAGNQKTLF
ncbi:MAG TPA: phage antirepressor N-terminal domain-containing protein [Anaerolineaceae bacterium]|nr:phage antirepressor N-terminal domain-containing protein [Anaerolineaceae bacterium]HPN53875.1 phage antirepressor N-terminal domain-containing protein [Anaerolineaceae bacterium]